MLTLAHEFITMIDEGGAVMLPLCIASLVLWWALGYRLVTLQPPLLSRAHARCADITPAQPHALEPGTLARFREEAIADFTLEIHRFADLVRACVTTAPLLGLLGTVAGMIETFSSLGEGTMYAQGGGIAAGISEALLTTQFGLAVAIPGLLVGRLLDRRERFYASQLAHIVHDTRPSPTSATAGGSHASPR